MTIEVRVNRAAQIVSSNIIGGLVAVCAARLRQHTPWFCSDGFCDEGIDSHADHHQQGIIGYLVECFHSTSSWIA
jgi:hypothetical protein